MTVVGNSDIQEALKAAAAEIKESVAKHGNVHPVVLQKLEAYIALLEQAGNKPEADKWNERAGAIRKMLAQQTAAAAPAAVAAPAPAPTPAAEPAQKPAPAPVAAPKTEADDGAYSLDDSDEEMSYEALEQAAAASKAAVAEAAASAPAATSTADLSSDDPIHLYDSQGEHIATAFKNYLYSPEGKNLGRYQSDFECFVDRTGRYIGNIHEGNRLVRDVNFKYASFNFGDKGNEGDRAGWGRTPDIERTMLPLTLENVRFSED
jgi:hypothetical protein